MGQALHRSAETTHAARTLIQRSKALNGGMSRELRGNLKTVAKWRKGDGVEQGGLGPKQGPSTAHSIHEEAAIVAFPSHTVLPLDEGLPIIPPLTRSSSHRRLHLNGRSCLPEVEDDKSKTRFKRSPI